VKKARWSTIWLALAFWLLALSASNAFAQAKRDWRAEWEETLAAAEKEGEVTLYGAYRSGVREAVAEFSKVFPKIKFNHVAGSGSELANKLMAEKRANKHLVDVAVGGSGTMVLVYFKSGLLEPMQPAFILPEVKDPSSLWGKKHHYADSDGAFVLMAQGDVNRRIGGYNTKLVKPQEIQSWWDVLNASWRGKVVMTDPRSRGNIGNWRYIYYNPELGAAYIRRLLSETEVTFSTNERQMMDWLASGRHAIYVMAKDEDLFLAMKQRLPVDFLESQRETPELGTGSGHIALFKNAPHPNAAKVYVNWFLSKEGQMAWQKYTGGNSFRTDIPKEALPNGRAQAPKEGQKHIFTSHPQYEDMTPLRHLIDELLAAKRK
jgi:iron(III) transport system substrate-binding protein